MRTWNVIKVSEAIRYLGKDIRTEDWLADPTNIALVNEHGDLALFEYAFRDKPIYSGHYYFKSRGQHAIQAARDFLDELFNSCYNISIVMGLVPLNHKAARWLTRQVGFTSYGTEEIHEKEYELFILTKKEFQHG